ncbi:MAG: membrane dipeptidase [Caldilineales bacterium]
MQSIDSHKLHNEATVVDLHAHPSLKMALFHHNLARRYGIAPPGFWPLSMRTNFDKLQAGGVDVLLSAAYAPEKPLLEDIPLLKLMRVTSRSVWQDLVEPPYFDATQTILREFERQIDSYNHGRGWRRAVRLVRTVAELNDVLATGPAGPIAIVNTLEGAHALEGSLCNHEDRGGHPLSAGAIRDEVLSNLDSFFRQGVASLTLAHFYPNRVVHPCFPFPETVLPLVRWRKVVAGFDLSQGLTSLGEAVVERMLELGMLIDVTHSTPVARARIYQIVESKRKGAAVFASHIGARAFKASPYCLEDWELRWIADHGGVAGVIFMNYWLGAHDRLGLDLVAETIDHIVDVAGIDAVGFGSDFDGFTDPPDDLVDATQMPRLTEHLLGQARPGNVRRYSLEDVHKILGGNALRMLREGWGQRGTNQQPPVASHNGKKIDSFRVPETVT